MTEFEELLCKCEEAKNLTLFDSFVKTAPKIETKERIICFVSGGADSDVVVDIFAKLDSEKKVRYVFFDTGIECEATKKHLDYIESKYGIKIERIKALVPVPLGCRKYGVPFWNKYVSEMIERLQRYGFQWENKSFDELYEQYPKCKVALMWWCNENANGAKSYFNISHERGLKEYMTAHPPKFRISSKCCKGAKKDNAKKYLSEHKADLSVLGLRKAEGGIRRTSYTSCFTPAKDGEAWDSYRPIFWYSDKDKEEYEILFGVTHSDCYSNYGLKRTGCAGCPFGKNFEAELEVIREYEPKLYGAVNKIFGESYEYTRNYLRFREDLKNESKQNKVP